MSYDIYFIKSKNLNTDNIDELLEGEVAENDIHFISQDEMGALVDEIFELGIDYETIEGDSADFYIELDFGKFSLSIFNSQAGLTVPYWNELAEEKYATQIESIARVFLKRGYSIYDPQAEEISAEDYKFLESFRQNLNVVMENAGKLKDNKANSWLIYIVAVVLIALLFAVWKIFISN